VAAVARRCSIHARHVLNNPLRYTDPSGHDCEDMSWEDCDEDPGDTGGSGGGDGDEGCQDVWCQDPFPLDWDGEHMLALWLAAQAHYDNPGFDLTDFLTLVLSQEFSDMTIQGIHTVGVDPLDFLRAGWTKAAYLSCWQQNGGNQCSSLSTNSILNWIGAYSQSAQDLYTSMITSGGSFASLTPPNSIARTVASSIIHPPNKIWTISEGAIGSHPAYYGNASLFSNVPGGIEAFLIDLGMPVLWWYGGPGEDIAYVFTINQDKKLAPYK